MNVIPHGVVQKWTDIREGRIIDQEIDHHVADNIPDLPRGVWSGEITMDRPDLYLILTGQIPGHGIEIFLCPCDNNQIKSFPGKGVCESSSQSFRSAGYQCHRTIPFFKSHTC